MKSLKLSLLIFTLLIYAVTVVAVSGHGLNWPAVAISDLSALNWRSQFDADLLMHLFLLATWISWREGFGAKGYLFGFLSIFMGGMFGFPYIAYSLHQAQGDMNRFFMGVQAH